MGLIYQLPISEEEKDFLVLNEDSLILKSYGLPPIFWLYLLAGLIFFSFLLLGAWGPVKTMISQGGLNSSLAWSLIVFLALIPMISLSFFFLRVPSCFKETIAHSGTPSFLDPNQKIFPLF